MSAIVSEGFRAEKFDPIPVFARDGRWIVGGDGHSRLEALRRLRDAGEPIPESVPVRVIEAEAAESLADTANVSRTPFSAVEEAEIFCRRLHAGETPEQIGRDMHHSAFYVSSRATLADLCETIKSTLGTEAGMSVEQGVAFAKACARHCVSHAEQQRLWLELLCKGDYTPSAMALAVRVYATQLGGRRSSEDMLFDLPRNMGQAVRELEQRRRQALRLRIAIMNLEENVDLLEGPIADAIRQHGTGERMRLAGEVNEMSAALGVGEVAKPARLKKGCAL